MEKDIQGVLTPLDAMMESGGRGDEDAKYCGLTCFVVMIRIRNTLVKALLSY